MVSTPDPLYYVQLQGTGDNLNTWGDLANAVFALIVQGSAKWETVPVTATSFELTNDFYVENQRRSGMLDFTGALVADTTVLVASLSKLWIVRNSTTGAFTLTLRTASGTGVVLPRAGFTIAVCDGSDVYSVRVTDMGGLEITNLGNGTTQQSAATLAQVSAAIAAAVTPVGGGAVRVSAFDTTAGFVSGKILGPDGAPGTILNPGGNETYQPSVAATVDQLFSGTSLPVVATAEQFRDAAELIALSHIYAS